MKRRATSTGVYNSNVVYLYIAHRKNKQPAKQAKKRDSAGLRVCNLRRESTEQQKSAAARVCEFKIRKKKAQNSKKSAAARICESVKGNKRL